MLYNKVYGVKELNVKWFLCCNNAVGMDFNIVKITFFEFQKSQSTHRLLIFRGYVKLLLKKLDHYKIYF